MKKHCKKHFGAQVIFPEQERKGFEDDSKGLEVHVGNTNSWVICSFVILGGGEGR